MRKIFFLLLVVAGFVLACNNSPETPGSTATIDSATKAASDTLKPSADTTSKRVDTTTVKPDTKAM